MPDPQIDIDVIKEITDMFIEAGIHMDAVNVEGLTAVQNCTSRKLQISIHCIHRLAVFSFFFCLFLNSNIFIFWFSFIYFSRVPACFAYVRVCTFSMQPTYKYCCDDTNSMRSAYDVLHHDV